MMWRSWDVAREKVFKKKVGTHIDTLFEGSPEDETSDTSETVDSYVGHDSLSRGGGLMNKLAIKLKENLKIRKNIMNSLALNEKFIYEPIKKCMGGGG